jgi:hypothetical protein
VTDYDRETGDAQTHYLKQHENAAICVEEMVTHAMGMHGIKQPKNFASLAEAEAFGNRVLQETKFRNFYMILIRTLGGIEEHWLESLDIWCDWLIEIEDNAPPDQWPTWVQGWRQVRRGGSNAQFLTYAKGVAREAKAGLAMMLAKEIPSLISRLQDKKAPLVGKGQGKDELKPVLYDRSIAEPR